MRQGGLDRTFPGSLSGNRDRLKSRGGAANVPKAKFRLLPKMPPFRTSPLESDSVRPNYRRTNAVIDRFGNSSMNTCDWEESFAYHNSALNVAVHMIFFCPIMFTALIFCCFTPTFFPTPLPFGPFPGHEYVVFNFSFFLAAFYGFYFITLDRKAGWVAAILSLSCWISANAFVDRLGHGLAWKIALVLHGFGWLNQFLGRGTFEACAPPLLDNVAQAFLITPFFVVFELLAGFIKYEPAPGYPRFAAKMKFEKEIMRDRKKEN